MPTVLVADDDSDTAELARRTLLAAGYHVVVASDGAGALAQAGAVDVAVLDVSMPVIDGRGVITHLRSAPHTRDLAVLVLSSHNAADDISAALTNGADDYLTKPFTPYELGRRVERLLATSDVQRRVVRRQTERRQEVSV